MLLALDVKSTEEQDWDPAFSARGGLELAVWREDGHPPRLIGILAEYYDGPSPYGQFFQNQIQDKATGDLLSQTIPIPEPSTYALMLGGLGLIGFMARRRRLS